MKSLQEDGTWNQRKKQWFISMSLKTLYRLLRPVASITQKLQARVIDIVKTYQEIQCSILDMQVVQDKVEEEFLVIYR